MKVLEVNFDLIQKAMEDIRRDTYDYYLDMETGNVIRLAEDIFDKAINHLYHERPDEDFHLDVEFDSDLNTAAELPDQLIESLETALTVLPRDKRYIRIPERDSEEAFACMKTFADNQTNDKLKYDLIKSLRGKRAFRKFKDTLIPYAQERKAWNRFNAKKMQEVIRQWLMEIDIKVVRQRQCREQHEKS